MSKRAVRFALLPVLLGLVTAGCATKSWVRKSNEPIQTQVEELATRTGKHDEQIAQANDEIGKNRTEIGLTKETANLANTRAGEAGTKAEAAGRDVDALRQVVANIDDYHVATQAVVTFGFNRDQLTPEAQAELDRVAAQKPEEKKRFFLAIEGFTDSIGDPDYNLNLSRRRADRVVHYLVAKHNLPVYRIFTVGLGEDRPADEATTSEARAKNRRVEVRLYTAEPAEKTTASALPVTPN